LGAAVPVRPGLGTRVIEGRCIFKLRRILADRAEFNAIVVGES
jgi:hypothetical protein